MYRAGESMAAVEWDDAKNSWLKETRGISFDDVVAEIRAGRVLVDEPHPNRKRYPHQRIVVVVLKDYVHIVPYVPDGHRMFLKTLYPSRAYQRRFFGG
jgi:uncharacterized DUF497 family protein